MMNRRMLSLAVIFIIMTAGSLVLISCGGSGGGSGSGSGAGSVGAEPAEAPQIFKLVPADARIVLSIGVGADFVENMDVFLAGCNVPVQNPTAEAIFNILDINFLKKAKEFLDIEDLGVSIDGNIIMMFRNLEGNNPVYILDINDRDKVESQLADLGNIEKVNYSGHEYTKSDKRKLKNFAFIGNEFIVCYSEADMKACIDAYAGNIQPFKDLDDSGKRVGGIGAGAGEAVLYVNVAQVMTDFGPMIDQYLPMAKQQISMGLNAQGMGQVAPFYMIMMDSILEIAGQADYASVHLLPIGRDLNVQAGLMFKGDSEFRNILASPDKSYDSLNNIPQLGVFDASFPMDMKNAIRFSRFITDRIVEANPGQKQMVTEMMDKVSLLIEGANIRDGFMTMTLNMPSGDDILASAYVMKADNPDQLADQWFDLSASSMKFAAGIMGMSPEQIMLEPLDTEEYKGAKIRGYSMDSYMQAVAGMSGQQAGNMDSMPSNVYLASYKEYIVSTSEKDGSYVRSVIDSLESGEKSDSLKNVSEFIPREGSFLLLISPTGYAQMIQKMVPAISQVFKAPESSDDARDRVALSFSFEDGDVTARVVVPSKPIGEIVALNKK